MKNDIKKTGNGHKNATAQLADINAQIETLKLQKATLAEPMKQNYVELRTQLLELETEIRGLDPTWKPAPLKPRADEKIREVITTHGKPMTAEDIIKELVNVFTPWKIKNTLKKKSTGAKAIFAMVDGKYSVKMAA